MRAIIMKAGAVAASYFWGVTSQWIINNLINDVIRLISAVFEEDQVSGDYHIHRSTQCNMTNPTMHFASHDFAVRVNAHV